MRELPDIMLSSGSGPSGVCKSSAAFRRTCGTVVQRIRYAENEANDCPHCRSGGTVLADRSLLRLLKDDWPRTIEPWERNS